MIMIGMPVKKLLLAVKAPLAGAVVLALTLISCKFMLNSVAVTPGVLSLSVLLPVGAITYLVFLYLWYPDKLQEVRKLAVLSVNRQ